MLSARFDDSGTHTTSDLLVIGGLMGNDAAWSAFDVAWRAVLDNPPFDLAPLKKWSTGDCRGNRGEFVGWSDAARDHVTYLFRQIILNSGLDGFAAAIDLKAWNELIVGPLRDLLGDGEKVILVRCIDHALAWAQHTDPSDRIAIIYDKGRQNAALDHVMDLYRNREGSYPQLSALGYAKVADVPGLQGADMIATESYWFGLEWLNRGSDAKPRAHFEDYMKHNVGAGVILDREIMEGLAQSIDVRDS
jgi:hypothetical protein